MSLAGRQLSHRVAAEYGTGGRLGWQSAVDIIDKKECRDDFERIDLNEILAIQNAVSKDDEMGFIWILCTCIFLVPEYNFSLVS